MHRSLQAIRGAGVKAGVALNPGTPAEALTDLLDDVDLICVMTVNPGFGGQSFLASQVAKVRRLRAMLGDRPVHVEIDGGVSPRTAPLVAAAGADVLVAGSAVFGQGSAAAPEGYGRAIAAIRAAAGGRAVGPTGVGDTVRDAAIGNLPRPRRPCRRPAPSLPARGEGTSPGRGAGAART